MKYLTKIEEYILGTLIILVSLILIINIILRSMFSSGFSWAEEFIRYGIIYITFIGMAVCFRKGMHVGVDLLMTSLGHKGKRILQLVINVLAAVFMVIIIIFGTKLVLFSMNSGQITPSLNLQTWMIYLAIPVGAVLSLLHIVLDTIRVIKDPNFFVEDSVEETVEG